MTLNLPTALALSFGVSGCIVYILCDFISILKLCLVFVCFDLWGRPPAESQAFTRHYTG